MIESNLLKEQIRQRTDLVELVSEHVALKAAGRDYVGLCPFHSEKTPSFSVSPSKQIFKCFGCGAGGDAFTFVQLRESVSFPEAMKILAERAGIEYERLAGVRSPGSEQGIDRAGLARVNEWAARMFREAYADGEIGGFARSYTAGRGISQEAAERFHIGWAPDDARWIESKARAAGISAELLRSAGLIQRGNSGDSYGVFRGRLMFPIRDSMNRVIGFGGRTLKGDRAKYLNTSQNILFDKGCNLYGIDLARVPITEKRTAVVVEGYTDCIAAHQHGIPNVVATLGTALTDNQVNLLRRWCDEIVLLFDSDNAGLNAADRAVGVSLRHNVQVKVAYLTEGKDPCDFLNSKGRTEFEELLKSGVEALVFKWERTRQRFASGTASGKMEAVREFVSVVAEMSRYQTVDPIQRGLVVNQLSALLGMPSAEVYNLLVRQARSQARTGQMGVPARGVGRSEEEEELAPERGDAEQVGLLSILRVLVNEPGYYQQVSDVFRPSCLQFGPARRVAEKVVELCDKLGEFSPSELLACFESPKEAQYVTDLIYEGSRLGNYEATITDTTNRLRRLEPLREVKLATAQMRGDGLATTAGDSEDEVEKLNRIQRVLAGSHGFAPGIPVSEWSGSVSSGGSGE